MSRIRKNKQIGDVNLIYDLIASFENLKTSRQVADFLADLLTANEIRNISVRLRIAKLLVAGESQREIATEVNSSLGTVNKISIWLNEGGSGLRSAISKLPLKWETPSKFPKGPIEYHLPELLATTGNQLISSIQGREPAKLLKRMGDKKRLDKQISEMNDDLYSDK